MKSLRKIGQGSSWIVAPAEEEEEKENKITRLIVVRFGVLKK
jgi:hypothetical protein